MSIRKLFVAFGLCSIVLGVIAYIRGMLAPTLWSGVSIGASATMVIATSKRREE